MPAVYCTLAEPIASFFCVACMAAEQPQLSSGLQNGSIASVQLQEGASLAVGVHMVDHRYWLQPCMRLSKGVGICVTLVKTQQQVYQSRRLLQGCGVPTAALGPAFGGS